MSLKEMIEYRYEEFNMLPIEVMSASKITVVGLTKNDCYKFVHFCFSDKYLPKINILFKDVLKTIMYDFDAQNKFILIFELYGLEPQNDISNFFEELLKDFTEEAEVIIDTFDDDCNMYRTSKYDQDVKTTLIK